MTSEELMDRIYRHPLCYPPSELGQHAGYDTWCSFLEELADPSEPIAPVSGHTLRILMALMDQGVEPDVIWAGFVLIFM
jgi:hypothetical protein